MLCNVVLIYSCTRHSINISLHLTKYEIKSKPQYQRSIKTVKPYQLKTTFKIWKKGITSKIKQKLKLYTIKNRNAVVLYIPHSLVWVVTSTHSSRHSTPTSSPSAVSSFLKSHQWRKQANLHIFSALIVTYLDGMPMSIGDWCSHYLPIFTFILFLLCLCSML